MSTTEQPAVGTLFHFDLTVDAPSIRDFYTSVVGWESRRWIWVTTGTMC